MSEAVQTYRNFIGGEWVTSGTGRTFADTNPAQPDQVLAYFQESNVDDVRKAADAAHGAFAEWRDNSIIARAKVLFKAADLIEARADLLAETLTREEGKTLKEARGETLRAAAIFRYFASQATEPTGEVYPSANAATLLYTDREPLGVVGIITPWNFPIAIPAWKIAPALIYGNTVVFKPANLTPHTAARLVETLADIGLPPGVLNFVTGPGGAVGDAILENPRVRAVSFTGSNSVGKTLRQKAAANGLKIQLELGGKNPAIVMDDLTPADLDRAAMHVVNGAMMSAGEKCTATGRVIVLRGVYDAFVARLVERVESIVVGDPMQAETTMGPLVSDAQLETVLGYIERATAEGGELLSGGRRPGGALTDGYFVAPTLFAGIKKPMALACEEVFGPVLAVEVAESDEEALRLANDVEYGLSASVFTRDTKRAFAFAHRIEAGIVHINSETAGAEPHVPFGGYKASSSFSREQGKAAREFFTQIKTIYFDPQP